MLNQLRLIKVTPATKSRTDNTSKPLFIVCWLV